MPYLPPSSRRLIIITYISFLFFFFFFFFFLLFPQRISRSALCNWGLPFWIQPNLLYFYFFLNFSLASAKAFPQSPPSLNSPTASVALGVPKSGSAPPSNRAWITSFSFLKTAPASGDCPRSLSLFGFAPWEMRRETSGEWPWYAASIIYTVTSDVTYVQGDFKIGKGEKASDGPDCRLYRSSCSLEDRRGELVGKYPTVQPGLHRTCELQKQSSPVWGCFYQPCLVTGELDVCRILTLRSYPCGRVTSIVYLTVINVTV